MRKDIKNNIQAKEKSEKPLYKGTPPRILSSFPLKKHSFGSNRLKGRTSRTPLLPQNNAAAFTQKCLSVDARMLKR